MRFGVPRALLPFEACYLHKLVLWVSWVCGPCLTLNEYIAGLGSFTNYSGILGGYGVPSWAAC